MILSLVVSADSALLVARVPERVASALDCVLMLLALYLWESCNAWANILSKQVCPWFCEAPPSFTLPPIYVPLLAWHGLPHTSSVNLNYKWRAGKSVVLRF